MSAVQAASVQASSPVDREGLGYLGQGIKEITKYALAVTGVALAALGIAGAVGWVGYALENTGFAVVSWIKPHLLNVGSFLFSHPFISVTLLVVALAGFYFSHSQTEAAMEAITAFRDKSVEIGRGFGTSRDNIKNLFSSAERNFSLIRAVLEAVPSNAWREDSTYVREFNRLEGDYNAAKAELSDTNNYDHDQARAWVNGVSALGADIRYELNRYKGIEYRIKEEQDKFLPAAVRKYTDPLINQLRGMC